MKNDNFISFDSEKISDLWDYKFGIPHEENYFDRPRLEESVEWINEKFGGFRSRKLLKTKYTDYEYFVYFSVGAMQTKRVNILEQCRAYCHEHGRRFTQSIRDQLEAIMPAKLSIYLREEYCPDDLGGTMHITYVKDEVLRNAWLSKLDI